MQENLRAGAIAIFCGEAQGGSPSAFGESSAFVQELLAPLLGGTDVDLITGTETSPHITQSETFATANPDNPNEIVVAYNDSRNVTANPINISGASCLHRRRHHLHPPHQDATVKAHSPIRLAIPLSLYNRPPAPGSRSGSISAAAVRASAGISPPIPRIPIAGPISAFTATPPTTASLAGPTTTRAAPSTGGCTSPGTTSMSGGRPHRPLLHRQRRDLDQRANS